MADLKVVIRANASQLLDALKRSADATDSLAGSLVGLARSGAAAFVVSKVFGFAREGAQALYEASVQAQRLQSTLSFASGGAAAAELAYVGKVANDLGLELNSTAAAYAGFAAAARGTALQGAPARAVFESIAKASAVMGLSAADSSGVLLALQQMMSKGTVAAEELRGQLGERLPGAFASAARAMGVSTAELGRMLEQGEIAATDLLPRLARQLEHDLAGAAERAGERVQGAVNRMDNAWQRLKQTLGQAVVGNALPDAMAQHLTAVSDAMDRVKANGGGAFLQFNEGAAVALGRLFGLNGALDYFKTLDDQIASKTATYQDKKDGGFYDRAAAAQAYRDLQQLTRLRQQLRGEGDSNPLDQRLAGAGAARAADVQASEQFTARMAKTLTLDIDIRREWADQAAKIARDYSGEIARAQGDPERQVRLAAERDQRLIEGQRLTDKKLLDLAQSQGAQQQALASAQLAGDAAAAQLLEAQQLDALERRRVATQRAYARFEIDAHAYSERMIAIERERAQAQIELAQAQLAREQRRPGGITPEQRAQRDSAVIAARTKLVQEQTKLAALEGRIDAGEFTPKARARVLGSQEDFRRAELEAANAADQPRLRANASAMEEAQRLLQTNRTLGADLIGDERERAQALLAIEVDTQRAKLALDEGGIEERRQKLEAFDQWRTLRERKLADDLAAKDRERTRTMSDSLAEGILDGFRRGGSFADVFVNELKAQFAKTILSPLIQPIVAGGNSVLGALFSGLAGWMGLGTRAAGGPVAAGGAYLVGERGPELLLMGGAAGNVIPNHALGAQSGLSLSFPTTIQIDARSDQAQVAQLVAAGMAQTQKTMWAQLRARGLA